MICKFNFFHQHKNLSSAMHHYAVKRISFFCATIFCVSLLFSCASSTSVFKSIADFGAGSGSNLLAAVGNAGASISQAAEEITPEQEYYIGRAVAANICTSYNLYSNEQLSEYLNSICQVLAYNSDRPELFNGYHVAVLDANQINAFATSGGHILVTRGLLECADGEDALAAVLAHEVAHIQLSHSIKAIKTSRFSNAILTTSTAALSVATAEEYQSLAGALNESVGEIVTTMVNKGYSKSQEYDADALALQIMSDAGYNPYAMVSMLNLLKEKQSKSSGGFATTHPTAEQRLSQVDKKLKKFHEISVPQIRRTRFNDAVRDL